MLHRMLWTSAAILLIIYGSRFLEKRWPAKATPVSEVRDDWLGAIVSLSFPFMLLPVTSISNVYILGWTGVGWIHMPTEGYWYYVSVVILVIFSDVYTYTIHRLEHAVPFLWKMHSYHHSANAVTMITGARHWWLEKVLFNAFFPFAAIVFLAPPDMLLIVVLIGVIPNVLAHLNVRIPMGRAIIWIMSPQWHRIHHSVHPEHHDKNFASFFPVWDILFGTAWIPAPDEYPDTGFVPPVRVDMIDSIIWPFRRWRRQKIASSPIINA